tara:strand:+ start:21792 stop:22898 length:1107 start_codon:yes stop_codon:yes gene_type:complete
MSLNIQITTLKVVWYIHSNKFYILNNLPFEKYLGEYLLMIKNKICVIGASGLVGSHITCEALKRGYIVNGTMRDNSNKSKTRYLKLLQNSENLNLFTSDMRNMDSLQAPLEGADCVFIASLIPTYTGLNGKNAKEMEIDQGYIEIIMPTVTGCMNILETAKKCGIKKAVICSSTSSANPFPAVPIKNEDHWSDVEHQCKEKKYTSAAKTIMEKIALEFCEKEGIRLSIFLPTGLYGTAILPDHMRHNPFSWIKSLIEGGPPRHTQTPNDSASMIHLHDLRKLMLAAYEDENAFGRYFGVYGSIHWKDIYAECKKYIPNMQTPLPIRENPVEETKFDFLRRDSLKVNVRDFPTLLRETVEWVQSNPFDE